MMRVEWVGRGKRRRVEEGKKDCRDMVRTRIKICGICRHQDAEQAAGLGADAVGIVMRTGMGRSVAGSEAKKIIHATPGFVTPVLLFVNDKPMVVKSTAEGLGVNHVQLHGMEDGAFVQQMKPLRVIKSLRVTAALVDDLTKWREAIYKHDLFNLVGLVLETATDAPGGSGIANDWAAVLRHQQAGDFQGLPPIIAAGGLTPDTVGDVIRSIRPYAVDVSSGVETEKRAKDVGLMRAFVEAVRDADGR